MRVISYIDGFNLYHAIDGLNKPHLKWLDLWALSNSLIRKSEHLEAVRYFSAYVTWLPPQYARHRAYVAALEASGVDVHLATFKIKDRHCRNCGSRWKSREEKETDVHIAVHLVADAFLDAFDRAIIISADSDLRPAIATVRRHQPRKEVFVAAPPKRFSSARDLKPKLEVQQGRLARCLLPSRLVSNPGGAAITRPPEYDPPPP